MSPPRRRSSRLAAVATKTRSTPELSSVAEADGPNEPAAPESPQPNNNDGVPRTPMSGDLRPSHQEMHPSKCHTSTAAEPSSALRLGFTDIRPSTTRTPGAPQDTPSRPKQAPATEFTFRFARGAADVPLSENAQRLMQELRDQANIIKADMQAQRALDGEDAHGRKIAQPKGKTGRFSAAHMAEFKKMDSIEGHASAWRANRTPDTAKSGLKRSPSKAELDGTPSPSKPSLKRSPSKAELDGTPSPSKPSLKRSPSKAELDGTPSPAKPSLKRTHSKANLGGTPSQTPARPNLKRTSSRAKLDDGDATEPETVNFSVAGRPRTTPLEAPGSAFVKRIKKFREDDTSKSRPISRDGSGLPRPTSAGQATPSSLARLMSPTKSSMGHAATPGKPTVSLVKSPSKTELNRSAKAAPAPASPALNVAKGPSPSKAAELRRRIISPKTFQRAKSILRGHGSDAENTRTALPKPALGISQTPGPSRGIDKELPPLPLTTPRRKLVKKVSFTPDTKKAADTQNSPSPQKFAAPSKSPSVQYPTLDGILAESSMEVDDKVEYPDLSGLRDITDSFESQKRKSTPQSMPGTFTFRSDHTIDFGSASPSGFGASPGQASLRQVRSSMGPKFHMPGSFPAPPAPSSHPDKENAEPASIKMLPGVAHGMANKKRHRASSEEGEVDKEGDERGAKKRKNEHAPGGPSRLFSQRSGATPVKKVARATGGSVSRTPGRATSQTPVSKTPSKVPGSATPAKKGGMSLSRLNMLARPKNRV